MRNKKIYTRNQLVEIVQQMKADGKVVVTTNGCFDVLQRRSPALPASRAGTR